MKKILFPVLGLIMLYSCSEKELNVLESNDLKSGKAKGLESIEFSEIGSIDIGGEGAAEISAFDPSTNKLFVVNNMEDNNRIDVLDFSDPANPVFMESINISGYGGSVNSVDVKNGLLASAIQANVKTDNGKMVVFLTTDYSEVAVVDVGALPDMVTFTPNGMYILTANEGEPDDDYLVDPEGSVSIISIYDNYSVTTLNFSGFASQETNLKMNGFRIFGLNASFEQDIEPEYIAVAQNSKKAWVSLQENNGLAVIDIESKVISDILPLGFKDYSLQQNSIDPSNEDEKIELGTWPVFGMHQPDGIAVLSHGNIPFVFTANEGDSRDYDGFSEEERIKDIVLDPTRFTNAEWLQKEENLGRLHITTTLGDTDQDGDYDELYSYGARSFSIWNGNTGRLIYDSENDLDEQAIIEGDYTDGRSDDKSIEPEGVVTGHIGNTNLLFVGMERIDAVAVYDITNPVKPQYMQWLKTGDAPEGILFIPSEESPNGKSLLVVSSEDDGVVTVYSTF